MAASQDDRQHDREHERADAARRQQAFAEMLRALARPEAFETPHPDGAGSIHADRGRISTDVTTHHIAGQVEILQTHASAVLLAGDRAYKLKKPNDFGFFDYSTPALRRHFCGEEVRLNARLAPRVYLGVAPVVALASGAFRFASPRSADALPQPGDELDGGRVADYAVVMVRLPEEATLEARIWTGNVRPELLAAVAERVAAFHAASRTGDDIARFGSVEVIQHNWDENFEQMAPYIGRALDAATFDRIRTYVDAFLRRRRLLFETRVRTNRIRDCHGDLRMQHIYFLDGPTPGADRGVSSDSPAIIDCIEFNERFRYSDVAAEIAFLTMELDAAGRPDLARAFTDAYIARTGDEALREVLPFYACYRACVRGKVTAFQLDEPEVPAAQREEAQRLARMLFALAGHYASALPGPTLLLVGGLMGVGKTSLARRLAHELGWALFSSDAIRKELAGLDTGTPQDVPYGQGIYSREWTARTYQTMWERAAAALAQGRSVILDASFARRSDRQAAAALARAANATASFVECVCPREVALARLLKRWSDKQSTTGAASPVAAPRTEGMPRDPSDGRPELYEAQAAAWQPFDDALEPDLSHLRVDTQRSAAASVAQVMDALSIARFACW